MGCLGPVGIKIPLVMNGNVRNAVGAGGGNGVELLGGMMPGRDFPSSRCTTIRNADAGDPSGLPLEVEWVRSATYELGPSSPKSIGATYLDEKGNETHVIGVLRDRINRICCRGRRGRA